MERIKRMLMELVQVGGEVMHLGSDVAPTIRAHGRFVRSAEPPIPSADLDKIIGGLAGEEIWARARQGVPADFSFVMEGFRVRARCFMRREGPALVLRPGLRAVALDELGLPSALKRLALQRRGLVLITGPSGSGKSTTVAAMLREIDAGRAKHVVMLECPVELDGLLSRCTLSQRQIGKHCASYAAGLRAALRQCADVITLGDLPDGDAVALALEAANAGVLVVAMMRAHGVTDAIGRLIGASETRAAAARHALAENFAGAVSLLRLPTADGQGYCMGTEVLVRGRGVVAALREGELGALYRIMQREEHMQTMDDALAALVSHRYITLHDAYDHALDKERFRARAR